MQQELMDQLTKLAYARSQSFCHSCYEIVTTSHCSRCGSDDLMRHLAGVGVEYGTDWVISHIVRGECTSIDTDSEFEEFVRSSYPETVTIGWLEGVDVVTAMKSLDPTSWDLAQSEWLDSEVSEGILVTLDDGASYYRASDLEAIE